MAGKVNRHAYQTMIDQDVAWLESMPRTLERDHAIMIVKDSVRAYYDRAGSCPEHPMPGKDHDLRPGTTECMHRTRSKD